MRIAGLELQVHDLAASCEFYCDALGFSRCEQDETAIVLEVGGTYLRLRRATGRPMPVDSRSNDRFFRHMAIAVRDMDVAYRRLRERGIAFVSEPVTLPHWNPAAAGIVAVYLRDPENHPVELIAFPPDKGHDDVVDDDRKIYLGIDHTAIVVRDTAIAEAYYTAAFGLGVESRSHNFGPEQAALCGLDGANLRITSLRGTGGIGLELLDYLAPAGGLDIPADTTGEDAWSGVTVFVNDGDAPIGWCEATGSDPDGHRVCPARAIGARAPRK